MIGARVLYLAVLIRVTHVLVHHDHEAVTELAVRSVIIHTNFWSLIFRFTTAH